MSDISVIREQNEAIVCYLQDSAVQTLLKKHISPNDNQQMRLLEFMLKPAEFASSFLRQKEIAANLGIRTTKLSEAKKRLNRSLADLSKECDMNRYIQLIFHRSLGGHFAYPNASSLDDLRAVLYDAKKRAEKNCYAESYRHKLKVPEHGLLKRLEPLPMRYPSQLDFEQGKYYRDENLHKAVAKTLKRNWRCLVVGNPGCGKTSFALAVGYEYYQQGWSVYYWDATGESPFSEAEMLLTLSDRTALVIVDNVHMLSGKINASLCSGKRGDIHVLMTSRNVDRTVTLSGHGDGEPAISYLDVMRHQDAVLELVYTSKAILKIIRSLEVSPRKIGDIGIVTDKCGNDLNIIRLYVRAWQRTKKVVVLSAIEVDEVLEDVYHTYLKERPNCEELLQISALSQYEIDVDSKWITNDISALLRVGLVQKRTEETEPGLYVSWLRVYHPSIAKYFIKAAAYCGRQGISSVHEYVCKCVRDYVQIRPANFLKLFMCVPDYHLENILWADKDIRHDAVREFVRKVPRWSQDPSDVQRFRMDVLESWYEAGYLHAMYARALFQHLRRVGRNKAKRSVWAKFFAETAFLNLGMMASQFGLGFLCLMLREMGDTCEVDLRIWEKVNVEELGKRARDEGEKPLIIRMFIIFAHEVGIPTNKLATFCGQLDFGTLGGKANDDGTDLQCVCELLSAAFYLRVPREQLLAFWCQFRLATKVSRKSEAELSSIFTFFLISRRTGVVRTELLNYLRQLSFGDLAKQSHMASCVFCSLPHFHWRIKQAGLLRSDCCQSMLAQGHSLPVWDLACFLGLYLQIEDDREELLRCLEELTRSLHGLSAIDLAVRLGVADVRDDMLEQAESYLASIDLKKVFANATYNDVVSFLCSCLPGRLSEDRMIAGQEQFLSKAFIGKAVAEAQIDEIAGLLIGYECVQKPDVARAMCREIERRLDELNSRLDAVDFYHLDLFLWHVWQNSSEDCVRWILRKRHYRDIIGAWLKCPATEAGLGIIGTYSLVSRELGHDLIAEQLKPKARKICMEHVRRKSIRMIRVCANDVGFSAEDLALIRKNVKEFAGSMQSPNQGSAAERLEAMLQV
ncbi:MAG: ATP-binding protein [Phycisphaerae bacterium]|nr:ATP-binding protein [Phycisphaerae bacterium]